MEEKGEKERRRSVGISTSGAGDSSRSGGPGGGGSGGSGLSEERSLLHSPSVSAYALVCVCIKHYILPSFICRDQRLSVTGSPYDKHVITERPAT